MTKSIIFKILILIFLFTISILTTKDWFNIVNCNNKNNLCSLNDKNIKLNGYVNSEIKILNSNQIQFFVKIYNFKKNSNLLIKSKKENIKYGQILEIKCKLEEPKNTKDFKYKQYLKTKNIYSICTNPEIKIKKEYQKDFLYFLFKTKEKIILKIDRIYKKPINSLISGILFGNLNLDKYLNELFKNSGISHITAISGYNMVVIINFLSFLFNKININRFKSFYIIIFFLFLFTILVGASASVFRAFIMSSCGLTSTQIGRKSNGINLLLLTILIMSILNPFIIIYDIGFQLSVLATFGIIKINPFLEKFIKKDNDFLGIKENFITTISAFLSTSGIIFYNFGNIQIKSIPINLLILPTMPYIMFFGFLSLFIEKLSIISSFLMNYIIKICEIFRIF